jgi:hypothetical protein
MVESMEDDPYIMVVSAPDIRMALTNLLMAVELGFSVDDATKKYN